MNNHNHYHHVQLLPPPPVLSKASGRLLNDIPWHFVPVGPMDRLET